MAFKKCWRMVAAPSPPLDLPGSFIISFLHFVSLHLANDNLVVSFLKILCFSLIIFHAFNFNFMFPTMTW